MLFARSTCIRMKVTPTNKPNHQQRLNPLIPHPSQHWSRWAKQWTAKNTSNLVTSLSVGNHTKVITKALLLQVLLGEVLRVNPPFWTNLQVSLGHLTSNSHAHFGISARDSNHVSEVVGLVVDLNVLVQELLLEINLLLSKLQKRQGPWPYHSEEQSNQWWTRSSWQAIQPLAFSRLQTHPFRYHNKNLQWT